MAPQKGFSPFSCVQSLQLLHPSKKWYVLSNRVCGHRPLKYFARRKPPARFPDEFVRVKPRRDQILVGIVPRLCPLSSTQSAKSVYPLAIANCKKNRDNLKLLIKDINSQKKILKERGLTVDGRHYSLHFTVTLDYKTLILLLVKKGDGEFILGVRGVDVEFCFLCDPIRRCSCHDVSPDETCTDCLKSKANIRRSTGIRDDEEELSSVQLCALHMEMRNTEQLLCSIGLVAYKIDSLKDANNALRSYGSESFKGERLTVQKKAGQQTEIGKHNIHVSSMSGPTERDILANLDEIVEHALPILKMKKAYSDLNTAKNMILNRITFCHSRVDYYAGIISSGIFVRDFGTHTEPITLKVSGVLIDRTEDTSPKKVNGCICMLYIFDTSAEEKNLL
ncbi:uncharacterized protein [Montipora capricornis]|uniref:uncharacterized protein n=1 Tax=Montipora capricornis TaxID=246305 RepID=UPI0035F1DC74